MFKQKLIYVCYPLSGDVEANLTKAKEYCKTVSIAGYIPFAPHVEFNGMLDGSNLEERKKDVTKFGHSVK